MNRFNIYDAHGKKIGEMKDAATDSYDVPETKSDKKRRELEEQQKQYSTSCWIIGIGIAVLMWAIILAVYGTKGGAADIMAVIWGVTVVGSFLLSAISGILMMGRLNIIFAAIAWGNVAILVLGIISGI